MRPQYDPFTKSRHGSWHTHLFSFTSKNPRHAADPTVWKGSLKQMLIGSASSVIAWPFTSLSTISRMVEPNSESGLAWVAVAKVTPRLVPVSKPGREMLATGFPLSLSRETTGGPASTEFSSGAGKLTNTLPDEQPASQSPRAALITTTGLRVTKPEGVSLGKIDGNSEGLLDCASGRDSCKFGVGELSLLGRGAGVVSTDGAIKTSEGEGEFEFSGGEGEGDSMNEIDGVELSLPLSEAVSVLLGRGMKLRELDRLGIAVEDPVFVVL